MPDIDGSSHIRSAEHDPATGELTVTFRSGARYTYAGVPVEIADGLHSAESAGQYLHSMVRGQYAHRKA